MTKMIVAVIIVINVYMMQVAMNRVLVTCNNYITFYIVLFYLAFEFYIKEMAHYK